MLIVVKYTINSHPYIENFSCAFIFHSAYGLMKYKCTREIQNLWMLILRYIQLQIMHYINNIEQNAVYRPCAISIQFTMSYTAVLWQKEATLENEISRKWAKCVCHVLYIDINAISLCLDLNIFQQD